MLLGALALLTAAGLYAASSTLVKLEAARLNIFGHNAYRLILSAIVMLVILVATRDLTDLARVPLWAYAALVGMVLCGLVIGDTIHYRAMLLIGLGRAFPIANSYPLVTLIIAALWLDEVVGWRELVGCLVTLVGVTLVALPTRHEPARPLDRRTNLIGVGLALTAALLWAGANSFAKVALLGMDVITANAVRLPVAALLAWIIMGRQHRPPPPWRLPARTLAALLITGPGAAVVAGLLTLYGVQTIGAARASILGASGPLFAVPLSLVVLRERLPARVIVGILLSVIGLGLIVGS